MPVLDKDKYGFINTRNDTVILSRFTIISEDVFQNGICGVVEDSIWGYINTSGDYIWKHKILDTLTPKDLSNWDLDSMQLCHPNPFALVPFNSRSKPTECDSLCFGIELLLDTTQSSYFSHSSYIPFMYNEEKLRKDSYHAYKLYLSNFTDEIFGLMTQIGKIKIINRH